ncbi:MAG TPA: DUF4833 domain-containing protein [Polyangiaceae bacterium]
MSYRHKLSAVAVVVALATLAPADARADEPKFGPYDVQTVFFISKSDDKNRVDYGMRLNESCAPLNDDAVFPYWREFEHAPPVRTHGLNMFEYVPYGIADQRMLRRTQTGGEHTMRLKQLARPISITTHKEADGHCTAVAHARISGVDNAELVSVYAKLAGALSVEYIDVKGKDPQTGAEIVERIRK